MKQKIQLSCQTSALAELRRFLEQQLESTSLSERDRHQVTLAVEEVCANLIIHSHKCNGRDHIFLSMNDLPDRIVFEIEDQGEAFNLLQYEAPDIQRVISEKRKGGLGIILVKKIMDEIQFESHQGTNTCRLIKFFQP